MMPIEHFGSAFPSYSVLHDKAWNVMREPVTGAGKSFFKSFKSVVDQDFVVTFDYSHPKQMPGGCSGPNLYYNLYLMNNDKVIASSAVNESTGYGATFSEAKAG